MAVTIKNPLTIVNTGGGDEPGGDARITGYNTTTGVVTGENFGTTAGTFYLLDRDTHTYVAQAVSSWTDTSITLSSPIDLTMIEGTTSIVAVLPDGEWSTKWLITGSVPVSGWGKLYIQDPDTRTVSTLTINSQTEFNALCGANGSANARAITVGNTTFYSDELVGFQFGEDFSGTIGNYFLVRCPNFNQPLVIPVAFGTNLLYFCREFNQPIVFPSISSIQQRTMQECTEFNQPITIPSTVTSIGAYFLVNDTEFNQPITVTSDLTLSSSFLGNCYKFNQPIDNILAHITSTPTAFMNYCNAFNQPITIPSTLTTIGDQFLTNCANYDQPITIPSTVTSLGTQFLKGCSELNSPIKIQANISSIGDQFLSGCPEFNAPLTLPSGLTSIGDNFLNSCTTFNTLLFLPSGVTSIGADFMINCYAFNQPLTLPTNLTSIGNDFMLACYAFNQPLSLPAGLTTIGTNFLAQEQAYNQPITIPSTVTSIGANFFYQTYGFSRLTTETTASPTDNNSLSSGTVVAAKMYDKGVTVTGSGASAWITNLPDRTSSPYRKLINGN